MVREAIKNNSDNFECLIFFASQLPMGAVLPNECSNRKVCSRTFSRRAIDVGDRLKVMYKGVRADGRVDWISYGCYAITFGQAGIATELKHVTGTTATIPSHVRITKQFQLRYKWPDMQADVFLDLKPPQQFMLHEFFPASVGPQAHTIIKPNALAWLALAAAAGREAQEQEAAAQKGLIAGDRDELADSSRRSERRRPRGRGTCERCATPKSSVAAF